MDIRAVRNAMVAIALLLACAAAPAEPVPETVWIPVASSQADGPPVRLEATVYKPAGAGPFPVVVFNHGASGGPIPADYTEKPAGFAEFLNARNIALVVPMRRGRGKSEGRNGEEPSPCTVAAAREGIAYAGVSLDAALAWLRSQPWADMGRLALAGHSRGGVLSAAYAADHPGTVKGVVNFSGGWKNDTCKDTCSRQDINLDLFADIGQRTATPSLFLYARGDGFYADASMRKYGEVYRNDRAPFQFRLYELEGANGHLLFKRGRQLWEQDVADFLVAIGLSAAR